MEDMPIFSKDTYLGDSMDGARFMLFRESSSGRGIVRITESTREKHRDIIERFYRDEDPNREYEILGGGFWEFEPENPDEGFERDYVWFGSSSADYGRFNDSLLETTLQSKSRVFDWEIIKDPLRIR
ncbi:hypothetical protein HOD38_00735 [archaeon]|jgi:hypothetical protein|nr:hypothetical protein [archaeon]MBT4396771.1 hypothetical protein [archaeon]MBT4441381.1 hypothetical protein [archaeon]